MDYEKRLKIPIQGNPDTLFYTKSGVSIAKGYDRIVIGGRGPYIEFNLNQLKYENIFIPQEESYRVKSDKVFYWEFRTKDESNVKIYFQRKTVDYADYLVEKFYISPFDLKTDTLDSIIDKLTNEKANKETNKKSN